MDKIYIKNNDESIIVFLDSKTVLCNNDVKPINNDILKYFKIFTLSDNNIILPDENNYKVVLDKDTGFKHFFMNGHEDYEMFFDYNGQSTLELYFHNHLLNVKEKVPTAYKVFRSILGISCCLSLSVLIFMIDLYHNSVKANRFFTNKTEYAKDMVNIKTDDITLEKIKALISNSKLSIDEKNYLYNEDYFNTILPYINKNNVNKYMYSEKFDNLHIEYFHDDGITGGFYSPYSYPNTLFINDIYKSDLDILSHEFIHLTQNEHSYKLLTEATAEILSYEFYDETEINAYHKAVKTVRKLMTIIGPEPILEYIIGGSFNSISSNIKPYLTDEQYQVFLTGCGCDVSGIADENTPEHREQINHEIDEFNAILDIVAKKKNITYDELSEKYYFNKKGIEKSIVNNRYITLDNALDLKHAMDEDLIIVMKDKYHKASYEELLEISKNDYILGYIACYYQNNKVYPIKELSLEFNNELAIIAIEFGDVSETSFNVKYTILPTKK